MSSKYHLMLAPVLVSLCLEIVHSSPTTRTSSQETLFPKTHLHEFHEELSSEDLKTYFGIDTTFENVPDYDIISPLHIKGSRSNSKVSSAREILEYTLTAFGEDFMLVLEHNDKLLTPGCVVEEYTNGSSIISPCLEVKSERGTISDDNCFYHGYSRNHNNSFVSVSTCSGLIGVINAPGSNFDLIIQPIMKHHVSRVKRSTASSTPHLIHRRQASNRVCLGAVANDRFDPELGQLIPTDNTVYKRSKRAAYDLYLETLLVADKTMFAAYRRNLKIYLLTLANVAAGRLLDSSLGARIHLSVLKIIIEKRKKILPKVKGEAEKSLQRFCRWQKKKNPEGDSHPKHFDTAALFTRTNLVSGGYSLAGIAYVGAACARKYSCSLTLDHGIGTGYTFVHELGHTLFIPHDGSEYASQCPNNLNIMATTNARNGLESFKWSACSAHILDLFLSYGASSCLRDDPSRIVDLPEELPGVLYDGNYQCEREAGSGYVMSTSDPNPCIELKCIDSNTNPPTIENTHEPALDGTACGTDKHCILGLCVDK